MKGFTGYLFGSVVLIVLGGLSLIAGLLDGDIVRVQHDLATLRYDGDVSAQTERRLEYASRVPWIGEDTLNEVRARRAATRYWRHAYRDAAPEQSNPVDAVPVDNVDLQLVVANALYRMGEAQAMDRQSALQVLDREKAAYLTVLKNSVHNVDAAYNFEYVVRLRDDIVKGRRKPSPSKASQNTPHGVPGVPPEAILLNDFKMHVPMSQEEIDQKGRKEAGEAKQPRKPG